MIHERVVYPIREEPPIKHRRAFLWVALAVLVVLFSTRTAISYYVDSLWFSSLGYSEVFWRTLQFKWIAFALPFVLTFLFLYGWFAALRRGCREELRNAGTVVLGSRTFELPVDLVLRVGSLIVSAFIALLAAASFMSEWSRFALYWFAGSSGSGVHDPIFGKSLGFYFFTLPALQFVFGWLLMLAIFSCAIAGLFLLLTGSSQIFKDHTYGIIHISMACAFGLLRISSRRCGIPNVAWPLRSDSHRLHDIRRRDLHRRSPSSRRSCSSSAPPSFWAPRLPQPTSSCARV